MYFNLCIHFFFGVSVHAFKDNLSLCSIFSVLNVQSLFFLLVICMQCCCHFPHLFLFFFFI